MKFYLSWMSSKRCIYSTMQSGWNHTTLGNICEIINGRNQKAVEDVNGKYPIYGSGGIMGYANDYLCKGGSTIIGRKGTINKPIFVNTNFWNVDTAFGLSPKPGFAPRFFFYLCKSINWLKYNKSTTLPSLVKSDLQKIVVSVPGIKEQEKIAKELDLLSEIVQIKYSQLRDLDALAQSIFYEMFGNPVANEKGWEKKKLGDVCTIERGGSPRPIQDFLTDAPDGINWIKIGDAVAGSKYISSTAEKIRPEGMRKSRFVHKGDFILSNSMSFGKPYILAVDGCIHDGWLVLRDNDDTFDKNYLYYYLSSPDLYNEFKRLAVGGVVNNLNSGLVRGVYVSIPPKKLQEEFAKRENEIESQRVLVRDSIKEVQTLLDSRMNYYFAEV